MSVGLQRRVTVTLNNNNQFIDSNNIKFYNRIHPNTVKSSYFFVQYAGVSTKVYLRDQASSNPPNYDGKGWIYLVRQSDDVVLNDQYGKVNYRTGDIEIPELIPTGLPTGATDIRINLSVQRASYNLATQKNLILTLDNTDTDIDKGRTSGLVVNVTAET
jgi:hypothetical protein